MPRIVQRSECACHRTGWQRVRSVLAALLIAGLGCEANAQVAISWSATSNGTWGTGSNWTGGAAPANSLTTNYASFNNATGVTVTTSTTQSVAGINFGSSAGAYTLSNTTGAGKTLTLGAYGIVTSSAANQLITGSKLALTLGAASSFLVNGTGNLTISASNGAIGTTATNTLTLGGTGSGTGTISSVISGAGSVTMSGAGTWVLSGANTFTGATVVNSGILQATSNAGALGAGALTMGGGTLELANDTGLSFGRATTVTSTSTIVSDRLTAGAGVTHTLGTLSIGAQTLNVDAGANVTSGTAGITFGATTLSASGAVFDVGTGVNLTLGVLTGNFDFTKQDAGTLTLNSASTRSSGATIVAGGELQLGSTSALGTTGTTLTLGAATLDLATNTSINAYNTTVTGSATILSDRSTAGSGITHTLGTLAIGANTLSVASGSNVSANTAFGLTFGATTLNGSAIFDVANNGTGIGTLTLGAVGESGGARALTKQGAGTLVMTGTNTYTGGTTLSAGTLTVNSGAALAGGTGSLTVNSGTLNLNNAAQTVGTFSGAGGTVNLGAGHTLTVTQGADATYAGTIAGSGALVKDGANTLTLSGSNSYTGATTISLGTLKLGAAGGATNTPLGTTAAGTTVSSGGALDLNGFTLGTAEALTLNGTGVGSTGALTNSGAAASYSGAVTLGAASSIGGTGNISLGGALSGSAALTKADANTLTLSGNSSGFTGALNINQGTVVATTSNNALGTGTAGTTVASGAMLALQGGVSVANGTLSLAGTGVGSAGALTNNSGNNTWNNSITLTGAASIGTQGGILTIGATSPGFAPSGDTEPSESGFITLGGNTLTFTGAGTGIVVNDRIRDFAGQTSRTSYNYPPLTLVASPETTTPSNVIVNMTGGGYVQYLANANSYTGTTTVQAGTLILDTITNAGAPHDPNTASFHAINGNLVIGDGAGAAGSAVVQLGSGGSANEVIAHTSTVPLYQDGTLNINNQAQTIDALTFTGGSVTLGTGTLYLNNDVTVNASAGNTASISGSTGYVSMTLQRTAGVDTGPDATRTFTVNHGAGNTYDLTLSGILANGNLVKAGDGVMMLNNNNTFVGTTAVNAGILNVQSGTDVSQRSGLGAGNGTDAQGTTVAGGATLQLQGGIAITSEKLNLSGTGYTSLGALNNLSGSNTFGAAATTLINLNADATITASGGTLTIPTNIGSSSNNALTFDTAAGTTVTVSGGINTGTGSSTTVTKAGTGTLVLTGSSSYQGATNVQAGVVSVQNNFGLGSALAGTTVASGAELQLSNAANGNLSIGAEALTISGAGIGGTAGALHNVAGTNSFGGLVTLAAASTIKSDSATSLTLSGGTSSAGYGLTIAGAGSTTISGNMSNSTGSLTKNDAGAFTFAGTVNGTTGTVGAAHLNAGTMTVGNGTQTTTLNTGAFDSAVSTTLLIASGGTVVANYASGSTTFSGALAGSGNFEKAGAGTLVFNNSFTAASLTLTLSGGTLSLLGGGYTFGTIHITGNTVLDFNNSAGTFLSSAQLVIDAGVTVTVQNWASVANNAALSTVWYATNTVNAGTLGGTDIKGGTPLSQITFTNYGGLTTTWVSGSHDGWFDHEIRPTPEPATYGAILISGCLGLLGWRRYRRNRSAAA